MTTPAQKHNLQELIVALLDIKNAKGESPLSPELELLLKEGLHHTLLPDTLQPGAAEGFQLTYEGIGGLPRQMMWADRNYGAFMKLYARQTIPTIGPVIPPAPDTPLTNDWPEWMDAQRLAYRVAPSSPSDDDDTDIA